MNQRGENWMSNCVFTLHWTIVTSGCSFFDSCTIFNSTVDMGDLFLQVVHTHTQHTHNIHLSKVILWLSGLRRSNTHTHIHKQYNLSLFSPNYLSLAVCGQSYKWHSHLLSNEHLWQLTISPPLLNCIQCQCQLVSLFFQFVDFKLPFTLNSLFSLCNLHTLQVTG